MSETDEQPGALARTYRSVGPRFRSHPDSEMDAIGWSILLGMVVLFLRCSRSSSWCGR